jgi:hypothetical protein
MLVLVLRAISSGDEAWDMRLGVVGWVPLRNAIGKLLFPEILDKRKDGVPVPVEILAVIS